MIVCYRYDPLRDAVRRVLAAWDADEKSDPSDELQHAMGWLRTTLNSVMRGGDERSEP